jgi:hypothetical protein
MNVKLIDEQAANSPLYGLITTGTAANLRGTARPAKLQESGFGKPTYDTILPFSVK